MLAYLPPTVRRVLDVGCNTGAFGQAIKKKIGAEVWGIEPNPEAAAIASTHLDHVLVSVFNEELPLPDNFFDAITFNDVLEHMPDPWAALKLAASKLTPDGVVIVSIPNLRHIDNLVHIMRERDFQYEATGIRDRTHLRFFTRKSAPRLFDGSGLTLTRLEGINEECFPSLLRKIAYFVFKNYLDDTRHIQYAIVAKRVNAATP
ncbi:MAG TPA: class I SAM-dependent methyltransferase [Telluria sp.]|nr:class I SAM-dependent methyltransferase [Telluria sp.]